MTGNKFAFYVLIIAAVVIAAWIGVDKVAEFWEWILGALGLGTLAAMKQQATKAKAESEVYEEQADQHLADSVNEINQARESNQEAVDIANDDTEPNHENLPSGFKSTGISSK